MHFQMEIILPPVADIKAAITTILAPFDENVDEDIRNSQPFWDYWTIGGRYAGRKFLDLIPEDQMVAFYEKLLAMKVTVSGVVAGKKSLQPKSQIPAVDAAWKESFPDSPFKQCPLFDHANDKYKSESALPGDILTLAEVPPSYKCFRVIIAGEGYGDDKALEAKWMMTPDIWNGVTHVVTTWDGTIGSAVEQYKAHISRMIAEAQAKYTPQPDWLVVTVDYHS